MGKPSDRQRAWLEKAQRTLRTARRALRDGDYDSCVSRTYYAVLQAIAGLLFSEKGRLPSHPEMIRRVVAWDRVHTRLGAASLLTGRRNLSDSLKTLQELRAEADYQPAAVVEGRAREATLFAGEFVRIVEEVAG